MLAHGGQLHHGHLEGAVPADSHNLPLRRGHLGSHGRRDGIPHGAHAAGGEELPFPHLHIAAGPNLVLAHVRHIDGVLLHPLGEPHDEPGRVYVSRVGLALAGHSLPVSPQGVQPLLAAAGELLLLQILEDMLRVPHQRYGRACVLADLRGIHIDMHQHLVPGDHIRLVHGPVGHPGPHHDQQVGLVHGPVGIGFAVVAHHPEIEGVVRGHGADSHHGGHHGDIVGLGEPAQLSLGLA